MVTEKMIEAVLTHFKGHPWNEFIGAREAESERNSVRKLLEAELSTDAEPVAWYWEDATGCFHITLDRSDVKQMAAIVGCKPKPLSTVAPPAPSVAVKALEWKKDAGKPDDLYLVANSVVGSYRISPIGREGFELRLFCADQFPNYASMAEAKAAARSDYEARIRSALSAQVQDVAVKSFIIEYVYDDNDVKTRTFAYDTEQAEAEAFCKDVKDKGGSVNIRIAAAPAAKQVTP